MSELERSALLREALGDELSPVTHASICPVHASHRLAIVGEAPGPNTRADLPFYPYPPTSAAGRLLGILGWTRRSYFRVFARANLLDEYPGPTFPVARAREAAERRCQELAPRPLLLMGQGVAAAFQFPKGYDILDWVSYRLGDTWCCAAVVPHTSGRSHFYNDPANRARVRTFVEQTCLDGDITFERRP